MIFDSPYFFDLMARDPDGFSNGTDLIEVNTYKER